MNAFFKTLFGDLHNLGFVLLAVALTALLVHAGRAREAACVLPLLLLGGAYWLAQR